VHIHHSASEFKKQVLDAAVSRNQKLHTKIKEDTIITAKSSQSREFNEDKFSFKPSLEECFPSGGCLAQCSRSLFLPPLVLKPSKPPLQVRTNPPQSDDASLTEQQCTTPSSSTVSADPLQCPPTPQPYGTYFFVDIPCEKALMMPLL
jgi:hypothetical protein